MTDYTKAPSTKLFPSNCCLCGKPLTDAESRRRAVGPKCYRRHAVGNITEESLKAAMFTVAINEAALGNELVAEILDRRHQGGKDAGRQIANLLLYHASARIGETLFVLKCADVLEAIGYEKTATQLRTRYARINVVLGDDGRLELHTPYDRAFNDGVRDFPKKAVHDDTKTNGQGRPKFKCWSIRKDDLDLMLPLLGWYFNGEGAVVEGVAQSLTRPDQIDTILAECRKRRADRKAAWEAKQAKANGKPAPAQPNGITVTLATCTKHAGYLRVFAPYHPDFTNDIKAINRRKAIWDRGAGPNGKDKFVCWAVPVGKRSSVVQLVVDHFGMGAAIDDQT